MVLVVLDWNGIYAGSNGVPMMCAVIQLMLPCCLQIYNQCCAAVCVSSLVCCMHH